MMDGSSQLLFCKTATNLPSLRKSSLSCVQCRPTKPEEESSQPQLQLAPQYTALWDPAVPQACSLSSEKQMNKLEPSLPGGDEEVGKTPEG